MTDVALETDVRPIVGHVGMEGFEVGDVFVLPLQRGFKPLRLPHAHLALVVSRLVPDEVTGSNVTVVYGISSGLHDLGKATLESTHTAYSYVILESFLQLVVDGRILTKHMTVGEPIDFAALVFIRMKKHGSGALDIVILFACGGNWNSEKIGEEAADLEGGISGVGRSKEWGTGQPLHDRLSPLDHNIGDFVLL